MSRLLLIAHIAAGFLSLVAAFVAAATRTFDLSHRWHVHAGRAFFAGMTAVFITAVLIFLLR
jgi:hypothetical protein